MFIDTHCHLHDREFFTSDQAEKMLARATAKKVTQIICVATSEEDSKAAINFAETHRGVFAAIGIHPENANLELTAPLPPQCGGGKPLFVGDPAICNDRCGKDGRFLCDDRENPFRAPANKGLPPVVVAIGEVGLDYHYEPYDRDSQLRLLEKMLQLAKDNNLPVIFHVREAFADFFPVINNFPNLKGVVHSFTDSKKTLQKILETTNLVVGVNGLATYSTLPTPPLERLLLETDAPFLTPVPNRGKINEPAYVPDIAKFLSTKLGVSEQQIADTTTKNARQLFNLPNPLLRPATRS